MKMLAAIARRKEMSNDLVKRSRKVATELEQWVQKYTDIDRKSTEAELIREQADRIEALEAQVAAADALADVLDEPLQSYPKRSTYEYRWKAVDDALAAYNEAKKGGA